MVNWTYYPLTSKIPDHLEKVVKVFSNHDIEIKAKIAADKAESNEILAVIRNDLTSCGYLVEKSKKKGDKIPITVLFKENGERDVTYEVDAFNADTKTVIEVESGRAIVNYQVLKDLIEACLMEDVDYLCVSLRLDYKGKDDYNAFRKIIDAIFKSNRFKLPLRGVLVIGY